MAEFLSYDNWLVNQADARYFEEQECERCNVTFPASYEMMRIYSYVAGREIDVCSECSSEIEIENAPLSMLDEECASPEEFQKRILRGEHLGTIAEEERPNEEVENAGVDGEVPGQDQ